MNASTIFQLGNSIVLLGWLLLFFAPKWKYTQPFILNGLLVLFAIVYAYLLLSDIGDFKFDSFSTLQNVRALFEKDNALAAGWLHYLAFDLFVGAYIVREIQRLQMPHWLAFIALPFTFMFGPMGYLIFIIIKTIRKNAVD